VSSGTLNPAQPTSFTQS